MHYLALPYPPSANRYWRKWRNRMVISEEGRAYRARIIRMNILGWLKLKTLAGEVEIDFFTSPPDKRKRDIDNLEKCLFDSLQHAGLYFNDNQICRFQVIRKSPVKNGRIDLFISERI
jgi:crossover junction endodeoxyribonuclease RusA